MKQHYLYLLCAALLAGCGKHASRQEMAPLRVEGAEAYVGITDFAQNQLGDIVFVDVTTVGETLPQNEVFGTIEAVKTVSDAFLPVGGEILEFNEALNDAPDRVNKDPYGEGWIVKIRMTDPAELNVLLGADDYGKLIG